MNQNGIRKSDLIRLDQGHGCRDRDADPPMIGEAIPGAVEATVRRHWQAIYTETRAELLRACPDFAGDWAIDLVARSVADGRLPANELAELIHRYHRRVRLGTEGQHRPVLDPRTYFGVSLRTWVTGQHGIAWEMPCKEAVRRMA